MNLLLDVGNSSVSWVLEENGRQGDINHYSYALENFAENFDLQITKRLSQPIKNVLVSSVGNKAISDILTDRAQKDLHSNISFAVVKKNYHDLTNAYLDVNQMGIDRWLAMIAAWDSCKSALLIVDCGTAVTLDCVDAEGQHQGGYIFPGLRLMQQALVEKTNGINVDCITSDELTLANNTQEAISHGATMVTVAAIRYVKEMFSTKYGAEPVCLITGGFAEALNQKLDKQFKYVPGLVLKGLSLYFSELR